MEFPSLGSHFIDSRGAGWVNAPVFIGYCIFGWISSEYNRRRVRSACDYRKQEDDTRQANTDKLVFKHARIIRHERGRML